MAADESAHQWAPGQMWSTKESSETSLPACKHIGCPLEQAVIVYLRLGDDGFGSPEEREVLQALEDQMQQAIEEASAGEFDGDEFGGGRCVLFMYGPDADRLYRLIEPLLKNAPAAAGGYAIKRYGKARDPSSREVRVSW
jgi:hypothetical protein